MTFVHMIGMMRLNCDMATRPFFQLKSGRPKRFSFGSSRSLLNLNKTVEMAAFNMPMEILGHAPESPPVPRFSKSKVKREDTFESVSQGSTRFDALDGLPGFFQGSSDEERSEPEDASFGSPAGLLRGPPGLERGSPATWQHFFETSLETKRLPSHCPLEMSSGTVSGGCGPAV